MVTLSEVGEAGLTTSIHPFNYGGVDGHPVVSCGAHEHAFARENLAAVEGDSDDGYLRQPDTNTSSTVPLLPGTCGWAAIEVGGHWLNATVSTTPDGKSLILTAPSGNGNGNNDDDLAMNSSAVTPTATAYGWAPIPMLSAYDVSSGLPVLPWNRSL